MAIILDMKNLVLSILSLCVLVGMTAACSASKNEKTMEQQLDSIFGATFAADKPGAAVLVMQGDSVLFEGCYGLADMEKNVPVTPTTNFCIASVSKQFAATAIMLLQEQGLLSTSDTIDAYFPDFVYGGSITIQNLLSMRSGLFTGDGIVPNSGEAPSLVPEEYGFSYDNTMEENRQAALAWLFEQPLNFEPGTRYEYSNSNYFLLAQIVEQVAGMPYEDFVRQRIFEPLGMSRSGFIHELWHEDDVALPPAADAENFEAPIASGVLQGAADLVTTAGDIDKWLTALRQKRCSRRSPMPR